MNKYSTLFCKAMDKKFNQHWAFNSYTYNDYHFTAVKNLPRKDRKRLENNGLEPDDVSIYRDGSKYTYQPFNEKSVKLLEDDGFLDLNPADY